MSCNSLPRLLLTSAIYVVGLAGIGVPVASAAVQNRITAEVSNNRQVAIAGSVHPLVQSATDVGPAPAQTRLGMSIRFSMTAAQEAALDQLLADQQNPSSPRYHQWLTPAQFGAQFGVSSADIAKVTTWLQSQGFTITGVGNSASFITFEGTVAQAQAAFGTTIRSMSRNGVMHFANVTDIQVPSALGDVVQAVTGLHDFRFRPHVRTNSVANPLFTSSQSGNHFVAPGDVYTIYNVSSLAASANGTGETIAVVGQVDLTSNNVDVVAFRTASGLSTSNLPTTIHAFGTDPGVSCGGLTASCYPNQSDLDESTIDVEWSGAMAPSATVDFVNDVNVLPGPTGTDSMTYVIDNNLAPIITDSYGGCEASWGSNELLAANALFKQANAQGQTILAAAGDSGATDCDSGASPYLGYAIEGLNVDFPGSSPYVTSLGGTQFNGDAEATGSGTTWSATQYWAGTTGSDVISSALSYIPEAVWNDATAASAFGGGGGGPSAFFTKPVWQQGTPADASRDVPDISLNASDSHDPFLYCVTSTTQSQLPCPTGFRQSSGGTLTVAGGTSFDSQIFGGLLALIEQKNGGRLGNINPTLYALGNSGTYASQVFHDVATGGNQMPCISGTPNCGNGGSTGFNAVAGYDAATGWGSLNVSNLATDWTKVTPLGIGSLGASTSSTSLTANPSTTTANAATPVTLTATVAGSAGTPTGSVLFLANNIAVAAAVTLSGNPAIATYSWTPTCANLGQNVIAASYSGDANYQGSKGPSLAALEAGLGGAAISSNGSVVVNPVEVQVSNNACPDFSITSATTTVTVAAGGTIPPVTITAAAINSFTGTVTFSATAISTSGYSPTLTFSPTSITLPGQTSTTLTMTGITADLRIPTSPGRLDPGVMLAQGGTPAAHSRWQTAGSGVAIASLLLLTLPRRRRRLGGLLLVALAVALIGGATGCGGSSQSAPPTTTSNPYAGTYSVTVVGTYTSTGGQVTTHSQVITYNIN